MQYLLQGQNPWLVIHQGQHNYTKGILQLSMLVQLIQHNIRVNVLAQLNNNAHALAVRFIPQVSNALNLLVSSQLCNLLNQSCLVHLIRQLCNYYSWLTIRHGFNMRLGPHLHRATTSGIGIPNTSGAHNQTASREIWSLNNSHQLLYRSIRIVNKHQNTINNLTHIMRRNIGSHTYRNTGCTVNQQLWELGWQYRRLLQGFIVVWYKIHSVLINILQHQLCNFGHAHLSVTHSCWRITIHRTKVTMAISQHIAHGEILSHTHNSIINRAITMRMIFTKNFAYNTG